MSWRKNVVLTCDCEHEVHHHHNSAMDRIIRDCNKVETSAEPRVRRARKDLEARGWSYQDGKDFCPSCTRKGHAGEA